MKKYLFISLLLTFSPIAWPIEAAPYSSTIVKKVNFLPAAVKYNAEATFQEQLTQVLVSTQALTEALVIADVSKAQAAAKAVQSFLTKVNKESLPNESQLKWAAQEKALQASLGKIVTETKIKNQREAFARFNETLFKSLKMFGVKEAVAYYQYCPMALEGEGAYWLSLKEAIRNPYLGNKMLTCGATKEVIK